MIYLIDMTDQQQPLLFEEFVRPLLHIIGKETSRYKVITPQEIDTSQMEQADGVILSGTALKDNAYLTEKHRLGPIFSKNIPVLGICAGAQVMASYYGALISASVEIGMHSFTILEPDDPLLQDTSSHTGYVLHTLGITSLPPTLQPLLTSDTMTQLFRHVDKPHYGVLFHPEVRWHHLITNFINSMAYKS